LAAEALAAGGDPMQPKAFLKELDDRRIIEAIAAAEGKSSGEIRVFVSSKQRKTR